MVRNSILIFCLCVCFCQYHISVSLYTHLYTHIINKLLHGWFVCTIFIIHSLWRIAKLTRSLRSLVRLTILHNSWIKIVRTHQPWSNLYVNNTDSEIIPYFQAVVNVICIFNSHVPMYNDLNRPKTCLDQSFWTKNLMFTVFGIAKKYYKSTLIWFYVLAEE